MIPTAEMLTFLALVRKNVLETAEVLKHVKHVKLFGDFQDISPQSPPKVLHV